jgi:hypothetical protein
MVQLLIEGNRTALTARRIGEVGQKFLDSMVYFRPVSGIGQAVGTEFS